MFLDQTLIESVDDKKISCVLKFRTFGNMSQKLWPNMLLFLFKWAIWANKNNHFFHKQKFEIGF